MGRVKKIFWGLIVLLSACSSDQQSEADLDSSGYGSDYGGDYGEAADADGYSLEGDSNLTSDAYSGEGTALEDGDSDTSDYLDDGSNLSYSDSGAEGPNDEVYGDYGEGVEEDLTAGYEGAGGYEGMSDEGGLPPDPYGQPVAEGEGAGTSQQIAPIPMEQPASDTMEQPLPPMEAQLAPEQDTAEADAPLDPYNLKGMSPPPKPFVEPDVEPSFERLTWIGYDYNPKDKVVQVRLLATGRPQYEVFQEQNQSEQPELVFRFFGVLLRDKIARDIDASEFRSPVAYIRSREDPVLGRVDVVFTMRDGVRPKLFADAGKIQLTFPIPDYYFGVKKEEGEALAEAQRLSGASVLPIVEDGSDVPIGLQKDPVAEEFQGVPKDGGQELELQDELASVDQQGLPQSFGSYQIGDSQGDGQGGSYDGGEGMGAQNTSAYIGEDYGANLGGDDYENSGGNSYSGGDEYSLDGGYDEGYEDSYNDEDEQEYQEEQQQQQEEEEEEQEEYENYGLNPKSSRLPFGLQVVESYTALSVSQYEFGEGDYEDMSADEGLDNGGEEIDEGSAADFQDDVGLLTEGENPSGNELPIENEALGGGYDNSGADPLKNQLSNSDTLEYGETNEPAAKQDTTQTVDEIVEEYDPTTSEPIDIKEEIGVGDEYVSSKPYSGKALSLEFHNTPLSLVLKTFTEESGNNFTTREEVGQIPITITLKNVPWDEALKAILETNGLVMAKVGENVVRVDRVAEMTAFMQALETAKRFKKRLLPTKILVVKLNNAGAERAAAQLRELLAQDIGADDRIRVTHDERTNAVVVEAPGPTLSKVKNIVERIDTTTPQVSIASRIVEVTKQNRDFFGIFWNNRLNFDPGRGLGFGTLNFPNSVTANMAVDPGVTGTAAPGTLDVRLGSINKFFDLDLLLRMEENRGTTNVLQSSKVLVLDREEATIISGESQFFNPPGGGTVINPAGGAAGGGQAPALAEIEFNLELKVTPEVTASGLINMDVFISSNTPAGGGQGVAGANKRSVESKMARRSGETAVIGGIYDTKKTKTVQGIPFFSSLPIVGVLFRSTQIEENQTELLIMITPKIVTPEGTELSPESDSGYSAGSSGSYGDPQPEGGSGYDLQSPGDYGLGQSQPAGAQSYQGQNASYQSPDQGYGQESGYDEGYEEEDNGYDEGGNDTGYDNLGGDDAYGDY